MVTDDKRIDLDDPSRLRTRHTLLFRLRDWQDQSTWNEFYGLYHDYVFRYARGAGLSHHETEDLIQDVFQKVAERIADFEVRERRGSFRRWLGQQVKWRITDKFRERQRNPLPLAELGNTDRADDEPHVSVDNWAEQDTADERWESDWQAQLLETALERLSQQASPAHLQIFLLHFKQEWSQVRIAKEMGVSMASVYAITSRLRKRLKKEVAALREQLC